MYQFVRIIIEGIDNKFLYENTFVLCLVIAIVGGLILHFVIEKPFMYLRERILIVHDSNEAAEGTKILNYIKAVSSQRMKT